MTDDRDATSTETADGAPDHGAAGARSGKPGKPGTTKKAQLIRLLQRKGGADVAAISRRLGWQAHTTRAALTGLRKAGYQIASERPGAGKPSRYRITAETAADAG